MKKILRPVFNHINQIKKALNWLVYGIFALYISYLVITAPKLSAKILFLIIGLIVIATVCLFEYLKVIYEQMIVALTFECDIPKALILKDKLISYDFFKGFKHSLILFDALLLLDQGQYNPCLSHLDRNRQFFHSTKDYLLIENHTKLQCAYFLQDDHLFDQSLKQLGILHSNSSRKNSVTPLYSWDEISGLKLFYQQRFTQSKQTLDQIQTTTFNPREEAYLLFEQAQVHYALKEVPEANRLLKQVISQAKTLHIADLAKRKELITFEKL